MPNHKFNIDKHALDQELRDRIRVVIRGILAQPRIFSIQYRERLEVILANLQPTTIGTNIERITIGIYAQWDNPIHSSLKDRVSCVLVLLRQLIINFWDYLLKGTDESLKSNGQIENHLETLENYIENGLDNYVVVGNERQGFWLMSKDEYHTAMEDVR